MLAAPGAGRLQLQIKHHVVLLCELQNLFQRRNALAGKFAAEPRARVEAPQFAQRQIVHFAMPVCRAIDRIVMNGDKSRVARKLQVGFDKRGAQRDGALERRQRIFRRVARGPAMCDDKHLLFAPRDNRTTNSNFNGTQDSIRPLPVSECDSATDLC